MMNTLMLLPLIGIFTGTFGTLIGAGGGFILIPILLFLYPSKTPEEITSISLAVVFFNALSGSAAYHRLRRIDYRSGIIFAIATIPGAIAGSLAVGYVDRILFNRLFGILLILIAFYLIFKKPPVNQEGKSGSTKLTERTLTDKSGTVYTYRFNLFLGTFISIFVGFLSSLLGIGGGIIHVPVMVQLLNFPIHIATATSQFVLAVMALTGTAVHLFSDVLLDNLMAIVLLSLGAMFGAQLGAFLSKKIKGRIIIVLLSLSLVLVGIKLVLSTL
jgi:hypothetical protein